MSKHSAIQKRSLRACSKKFLSEIHHGILKAGFPNKCFYVFNCYLLQTNRAVEGRMKKTIATRIPIELEEAILEFMKNEGVDKSTAIRRILEMGINEWKKKRAIELYRAEKITLWKASEIAGVSLREMLNELNRLRIVMHVAAKELEEDIEAAKEAEF